MKKIYIEYAKFAVFLLIVLKLTSNLMDMISQSWKTPFMNAISNEIQTIDSSGISIFITFVMGFYIGSSILLFMDRKKKIQALILLAGVVVIYGYMSANFAVGWNILYILIGMGTGIFLGMDRKNKKNFRKAASNVSLFSVGYASLSLVILNSSTNNRSFIEDSIVLLIFSVFFGMLMSYEMKNSNVFILGPKESGKTSFMAGCYLRAAQITRIPTDRSDDLIDLVTELHKGWAQRTKYLKNFYFKYESGRLFPQECTLRAIDYPGVYLEDIANYMYTNIIEQTTEQTDAGVSEVELSKRKATHEVMNADTLIFIIDALRYPHFEEMGIGSYLKIITKLREHGKDIKPYIAITKCDIFKDEYPNYEEDKEGFREYIVNKFSENIFVRELVTECTNKMFYPVFFYTRQVSVPIPQISSVKETEPSIQNEQDENNPNSRFVPIIDAHGNIHTYGFDVFMQELMESE